MAKSNTCGDFLEIIRLKTPLSEDEIRKISAGSIIYVSGRVITARDEAHIRALEYSRLGKELPCSFDGLVLYHCGPLGRKKGKKWEILAAGPTTSMRMEGSEAEFVERFRPRIIIGKGGMGKQTTEALAKYGVIYCDFTGGAAVLAAMSIEEVEDVKWLDLGMSEALWVLKIKDFGPLIVTIDSHGNNLHYRLMQEIKAKRDKIQ